MKVIISDTSPIHYLALIKESTILPALFGQIVIPKEVSNELQKPKTPNIVKAFAVSLPAWLEIRAISVPIDVSLGHLDKGEQEAITLAKEIQADTLLIDEIKGRRAAELHGLRTMGTLRILYDAAMRDMCDLQRAFEKLRQTNFRATEDLYQYFLELQEKDRER